MLFGVWRWPFTVRTTPPGVAQPDVTACFSVHVLEEPAGTTPMKICDPSLLLVSRTQQSSTAVSWITTSCEVGVGDGCAVGFALAVGRVRRGGGRRGLGAPPLWCDTSRYVPNPMMASSTTATIMLRLGERRSRILTGLDGSNTSAALIVPGGPCSASYALISGTGSVPTTPAMLRMCPRA